MELKMAANGVLGLHLRQTAKVSTWPRLSYAKLSSFVLASKARIILYYFRSFTHSFEETKKRI